MKTEELEIQKRSRGRMGLCKGRADHREGAESPVTPQCRSYLNLKPNSPGKDIH